MASVLKSSIWNGVSTVASSARLSAGAADIATLVSDLLENARVHAPGSAVRVAARVEGGVVALTVRDWGPGLSATESQWVFERSYRGARPISAGVPGSGLGLYTARRLARQMQGDLNVRAPAGGGCCLVATLPAAQRSDDQVLEALEADLATGAPQLVEVDPRHRLRFHHHRYNHDEGSPL